MEKTIIKSGYIKIKKQNFHHYQRPISIDNLDANKRAVSNKVSFDKNRFQYFIDYENTKEMDLYLYFFQKWLNIEEVLIKLNVWLSW